MRRRRDVAVLVISLGMWLAAGPGGITVQAIMACAHTAKHTEHAGHESPANQQPAPDAPCFCDGMTPGSDVLLSFAQSAPVCTTAATVVPNRDVGFSPPAAPHASFIKSPIPPPPNTLA